MAGTVAALLVGLSACGSSDDSDSSASSSASGGASEGAFPAKVATKFGEVTVDKQPQRIVALGWGDAETVLALGGQPVGASDWLPFGGEGVGPWAKGMYDKKPELIGTLEPEFEKIASLQPDLILDTKSSGDQTRYDTLKKIAPTVGVPKGGDQYKISWEQQTTMIAAAMGVPEKGEELIAETEKKFEAAAKAHPEFKGKTITVGSRTSEGFGVYVGGTGRIDFVERLGFKNNPKAEARGRRGLLRVRLQGEPGPARRGSDGHDPDRHPGHRHQRRRAVQGRPSVKAGNAIVFDDKDISQAFATDSILSVSYALEKVVPLFAEKVAK